MWFGLIRTATAMGVRPPSLGNSAGATSPRSGDQAAICGLVAVRTVLSLKDETGETDRPPVARTSSLPSDDGEASRPYLRCHEQITDRQCGAGRQHNWADEAIRRAQGTRWRR